MVEISEDGALTFIRGDTINIPMEFYESDGTTPLDLTGCVFTSQIRSKPNGYIVLEFEIDHTLLGEGKITVHADADETEVIRVTEGWWDLQKDFAGVIDTVIGPAPVFIIKDITIV